jgi:pre-mRNA-splicing factor ISY1
MARAAEKAQGLLNRWTTYQTDLRAGSAKRRPYLSSECKVLPEAEKWRRELVKEISEKVELIQNAGLGEHRIRELNDEINKLIREKGHWERRIKQLGGPDYAFVSGAQQLDAKGNDE